MSAKFIYSKKLSIYKSKDVSSDTDVCNYGYFKWLGLTQDKDTPQLCSVK